MDPEVDAWIRHCLSKWYNLGASGKNSPKLQAKSPWTTALLSEIISVRIHWMEEHRHRRSSVAEKNIARSTLQGLLKRPHVHPKRESAFGCLSLRGHHQGNCHSQERKRPTPIK